MFSVTLCDFCGICGVRFHMQIVVTGRHFQVTEAIKRYLETKVSRLERFGLKLVEAHVILTQEKYRHIAEVALMGKHLQFAAKEVTHDMYASIDQMFDTIWIQVERYHERLKSHRVKHPGNKTEA